jgi:nucleoside phosphorylase
MDETHRQFRHHDYTVAWICSSSVTELVVARAMLDEEHPVLAAADPRDTNVYFLGRIGSHNVVIASLPAEKKGLVSTAIVATELLHSFKAIRFGLMVGVGSGAPYYNEKDDDNNVTDDDGSEDAAEDAQDIRLGDVVISLHSKSSDAVVQYDFGKSVQEKGFIRTGTLNKPPRIVLSAVGMLQSHDELKGHNLSKHLSNMLLKYPRIATKFRHPGVAEDQLFKSDFVHPNDEKTCRECCGSIEIKKRKKRSNPDIKLHYGTIGSADQVMEDAVLRDKWAQKEKIMCFDMNAAGKFYLFVALESVISDFNSRLNG